ncbi:hypothetical protein GV792_18015 [Nocardia cyriacigeorgica]|uniref:Uncharacterized protein n=1 Tax=Nocardia cyriacigeorgica TaxID=135487 RepID=A0A6P1D8K4_9NOCA|nr:hypothetical protein [Nocardia cyriacigeorgica]NEW46418.1 hypothetical protein [Nocardia cyriacigeorgica]NEW51933.1 hypothetical protein [Nocardia cyriacigeorgica]
MAESDQQVPGSGGPQYGPPGTGPSLRKATDPPPSAHPGDQAYPADGGPAQPGAFSGYPQQPAGPRPTAAFPPVPSGMYPAMLPGMPGAMPMGVPGGFLMSIGDIGISEDSVTTPAGSMPLRGAIWTITDMSQTSEKIPTYAVVLAILLFPLCFLGLLFLLVKEKTTVGYVQVTVTSEGRYHSTMIPAQNQQTFPMLLHQVNYARALSAR